MRCRGEQVISTPQGPKIIRAQCARELGFVFFTHALAFSLGMVGAVVYLVLWGLGIPLPLERIVECVTR